MAIHCDRIWRDARVATMAGPAIGRIEHATIAASDGRIVYVGAAADAPTLQAETEIECDGRWITPGLIDCHTHLVYAGNRAREFEQRLTGASYEEIARSSGGIVSTMRATRDADEGALMGQTLKRLDAQIAEGVTTVEIKSGYGLSLESELKQLRVARALSEHRAVRVRSTLLAAHALPPEFANDPDAYIDYVCTEIIPAAAEQGLADFVDAFCENIGFSPQQTGRVFEAARAHGLRIKLHAEQLSPLHGASLAAEFGALSADHLEYADEADIIAMAQAGTVAVLLPGAYYFTRETRVPPVHLFRQHNVPMAIATDSNPGTSPMTSLLLAMNIAATLFRMTVDECLLGVTRNAAAALGLQHEIGALEAGKACDLAIWEIEDVNELVYNIGANPLHARVWGGQ